MPALLRFGLIIFGLFAGTAVATSARVLSIVLGLLETADVLISAPRGNRRTLDPAIALTRGWRARQITSSIHLRGRIGSRRRGYSYWVIVAGLGWEILIGINLLYRYSLD